MGKFLIIWFAVLLGPAARACQLAPLNSCRDQDRVKLEKSTFSHLEKDVTRYQDLLDQHLEKALKKKTQSMASCFNYHFSNYYLKAIREFAKKNRGYFCTQHLPLLYSSIGGLVNQKSSEGQMIKTEQAKLDLLNQAMEVSEALLYFKNKHTK